MSSNNKPKRVQWEMRLSLHEVKRRPLERISVWDESRHDHVKAGFNAMTNSFSDMQITIEDIFGAGDLIALSATFHAIHSGMYQNIPPTQKQIRIATNDIYTIENGKISGPLAKVD